METTKVNAQTIVVTGFSRTYQPTVTMKEPRKESLGKKFPKALLLGTKEGFIVGSVEVTGLLFEVESLEQCKTNNLFKYANTKGIEIKKGQTLTSNFSKRELDEINDMPVTQFQYAYILGKVTPGDESINALLELNQTNLVKCPLEMLVKNEDGIPTIANGTYNLVVKTIEIGTKEVSFITIAN